MNSLRNTLFWLCCGVLLFSAQSVHAQGAPSGPSSSLPAMQTASVSSVAYADLTYAAEEIYKKVPSGATYVVIYDANSFSQLASYQAALSQIKIVRRRLCRADQININATTPPATAEGVADLSGLSGVANLIQVLLPTYNNASANLQIPQSAMVTAMLNTIRASNPSVKVIVPTYVFPSFNPNPIPCGQTWQNDNSFTNQWAAAPPTAESLRQKLASTPDMAPAIKKILQDALAAFDDFYKAITVSDKGDPLLPHLLAEENLATILEAPDMTKVAVLDVQLDFVGADSVTRVWFGTIKTLFSADVLTHYVWLVPNANAGTSLSIGAAGTVDVLSENINPSDFAKSKTLPHRIVQTSSPMP